MPSWSCSGVLWVAVLGCAACTPPPAVRAAQRGDRAALAAVLATRQRAGDLSNEDAACLAKTVASHDLREADDKEGVERVRDSTACARELDGALAARMTKGDAAGARAALARIDGGGLGVGDARALTGEDPGWRAVAARGLVRPEDRAARLRALLDPEPLVRRQAARAAADAADPDDLDALAEAVRLDPEPIVRTEAVRALVALGGAAGGRVMAATRDLWRAGDDALREDVARAWSRSPLWEVGGREALRLLVAAEEGPAAIEGAAAILGRKDADVPLAQAAIGQLERAIGSGPRAHRLQALAEAPLDRPEIVEAIHRASADDDLDVRVGALARLAEGKDPRVIAQLEPFARPESPVAARARFALARAGDRRVQGWIEQDLADGAPERRLGAATELAALGLAARGAPLLADEDGRVRMRAACTLILAARGK